MCVSEEKKQNLSFGASNDTVSWYFSTAVRQHISALRDNVRCSVKNDPV